MNAKGTSTAMLPLEPLLQNDSSASRHESGCIAADSSSALLRSVLEVKTELQEPLYEKVVKAALGFQHGAALTGRGEVVCWGKGERGQLGSGKRENISEPVRIYPPTPGAALYSMFSSASSPLSSTLYPKAVDVQCGLNHTACLLEDGSVMIWGKMQSDTPVTNATTFDTTTDASSDRKSYGSRESRSNDFYDRLVKKALGAHSTITYEDQLTPRKVIFRVGNDESANCKRSTLAVEIACSSYHTAIRTVRYKV